MINSDPSSSLLVQRIGNFVPFSAFQQRDLVIDRVYQFRETYPCYQVYRYKDKETGKTPLDQATDRAKELCTKAGFDGYTLPVFALDNEPYQDKKVFFFFLKKKDTNDFSLGRDGTWSKTIRCGILSILLDESLQDQQIGT